MNLPIRRGDDRRPEQEFEELRSAFATQLDHWPDFFGSFFDALDDVLPAADLEESDDSYLLEVELPGVQRGDVDLQVDPDRLRLTAERRERERVGWFRHRTRTRGRFALEVSLPLGVDPDGVSASLDRGVLSVVLPKAEPARRRRIPVGRRG